jgi:hypothetical protein
MSSTADEGSRSPSNACRASNCVVCRRFHPRARTDVTPEAIEIDNVRFVSSRVVSDGRPFSRTGRARRPAGPGERVRAAGRVGRGDPPRREPVAGAARRGRDRQDGAAGIPDRVRVGSDRRPGGGGAVGHGAGLRRPASAVRAAGRSARDASGAAAAGHGDRVRAERRRSAGSLSCRLGGVESVCGGGRAASAAVCRR